MSENHPNPTGNQPPQFNGGPEQGTPQYQGGNQPAGQPGYGQPQYQGSDFGQRSPLDRPKSVKTASVLIFIVGGLTILGGLFGMLGGLAASASTEAADALQGIPPGALIGLGVVDIILGLVLIFAGVAVRKGKNWGRIATLVITILLIISFIVSLIGGNFSGIVGVVLLIIASVNLWKGEGAAWFKTLQGHQAR
ncbi:hypothetical protein [Kocuria sp. HSID16901]|uniref:hypothetical protein n=1 Tax=Kocuria sp. HSID16901 TaxID=2419505 RepID=UPI00066117DF|nr:hypothetical protein [Kocuria sp. HSID16901]RUQ21923.1 hypothetical protein D8M21_06490 [Kocuria sp. HSID16901]